jgi:hypothetical protein
LTTIPLTKGKFAIVDDKRYESLRRHHWYAFRSGERWYAARTVRKKGKKLNVLMHRVIAGTRGKMDTDHINGDTLDNREMNLRICTRSQNLANQRVLPHSSMFKGVRYHKLAKKWIAEVGEGGRTIYLGLFVSEVDAAKAYDQKAKELFGEFSLSNFQGERE